MLLYDCSHSRLTHYLRWTLLSFCYIFRSHTLNYVSLCHIPNISKFELTYGPQTKRCRFLFPGYKRVLLCHDRPYLQFIIIFTSTIIDECVLSTHLYFVRWSVRSGIKEKLTDWLSPIAMTDPFVFIFKAVMYCTVKEEQCISIRVPSCPKIVLCSVWFKNLKISVMRKKP